MYTTIRTYSLQPGSGSELTRRIQALVEPQIRRLPGLVDYYLLEVSPDQITSISLFDNKGHADMANGPIDFWMRKALGDCVQGLPRSVSARRTATTAGRQAQGSASISKWTWSP